MIETTAIGFEVPMTERRFVPSDVPCYVAIELGSDDPWKRPGESKPRPGWKSIGTISFDENGKRQECLLDDGILDQMELQLWKEKQQSGYPMPERPNDYVMRVFIAKYASTFTDASVLKIKMEYPQQLPIASCTVLRCRQISFSEWERLHEASRVL